MDQPGTVIAKDLITKSYNLLPDQKYSIYLEDESGERTDMTVFLYGEEKSPRTFYTSICILIMLVTLLGGIFYLQKDRIPLRISAPCMFLALGLLWEIAQAPLSAPDEMVHFARAYQISSQWLGEPQLDVDGYPLVEGTGLQKMEFNGNFQYMMHFWEDTQGNEQGSYYSYSQPPYLQTDIPYYLPATAITLCRLAGASYQWIVISGRVVNLLLYTLCCGWRFEWRRGFMSVSLPPFAFCRGSAKWPAPIPMISGRTVLSFSLWPSVSIAGM